MNKPNFEFPSETTNPKLAYSNLKQKVLITDIELRKDKKDQDYWIIKTQSDEWKTQSYLAFSNNVSQKTKSLLTNFIPEIINKFVWLTIKKKDDFAKVIAIELE